MTHARIELAFTAREAGVRPVDECAVALPRGVEPRRRGLEGRALQSRSGSVETRPAIEAGSEGLQSSFAPCVRVVSVGAASESRTRASAMAKLRASVTPWLHRRAGTEIRTRLVLLGRPTSRLEKYPQLPRPAARLSHFSGRPYSRRPGSAFGIAGAGCGSRTHSHPIPKGDASEDEPALRPEAARWKCRESNPQGLLARKSHVPTHIPVVSGFAAEPVRNSPGTVPANRTLSYGFGIRSATMACTV